MEPPPWVWDAVCGDGPGQRVHAVKTAMLVQLFRLGEEQRDGTGARVMSTAWRSFEEMTGYSRKTLDRAREELVAAGILLVHKGNRGGAPTTWRVPVARPECLPAKRKPQGTKAAKTTDDEASKMADSTVHEASKAAESAEDGKNYRTWQDLPPTGERSTRAPTPARQVTTPTGAASPPPPPKLRGQILRALRTVGFKHEAEFMAEQGYDWWRVLAAMQRYLEEQDRRELAGHQPVGSPAGWIRTKLEKSPALAFDGGEAEAEILCARLAPAQDEQPPSSVVAFRKVARR